MYIEFMPICISIEYTLTIIIGVDIFQAENEGCDTTMDIENRRPFCYKSVKIYFSCESIPVH